MVIPVFVTMALGTPFLALMGVLSALGEWATEVLGRVRPHSPPLRGARSET